MGVKIQPSLRAASRERPKVSIGGYHDLSRFRLSTMRLPWKGDGNAGGETGGLGLDSIRFDTLGLIMQPDTAPNEREWRGTNLVLSEHWFPIPPDLPSLQVDELRTTYEEALMGPPQIGGRTPRLLHLAVHRELPLPAVCTLIRLVPPRGHGFFFASAITLPLAESSWVIRALSSEGQLTGVREALAGARFLREHRLQGASAEELLSGLDPYEAKWDLDENDPLTLVRHSISRILSSLEIDPRALYEPSFA